MDINATVDVGKNLTSLLERLAQHIGTTADKVFPWYVQQAHNEGITTLVGIAVLGTVILVVGLLSLLVALKGGKGVAEGAGVLAGICTFGFVMFVLIGSIEGIEAARKIMNPNYYAMTAITRDIGRLTAR